MKVTLDSQVDLKAGKPKHIEQGRLPEVAGSHQADSLNRGEVERMEVPSPTLAWTLFLHPPNTCSNTSSSSIVCLSS